MKLDRTIRAINSHSYIVFVLFGGLGLFLALPVISRAQTIQVPGGIGGATKQGNCPHRRISERGGQASVPPPTSGAITPSPVPSRPATTISVKQFAGSIQGDRFSIDIELSDQPQSIAVRAVNKSGGSFILGPNPIPLSLSAQNTLHWAPKLPRTYSGPYTFTLIINGKDAKTITVSAP